MGLLIIVLVAAYVIRKKAEAARRKEMDRHENNEGGIWPSDRPLTKSESFAKAKEEYFMACLEKKVEERHPGMVRMVPVERNYVHYPLSSVLVRVYMQDGTILTDRLFNDEIWGEGSSEPLMPDIDEDNEAESEENVIDLAHSWLSRNVPDIRLAIEEAKLGGRASAEYDIPAELVADDEAMSVVMGTISDEFEWVASIGGEENAPRIIFANMDAEIDEIGGMEDLDGISMEEFAYASGGEDPDIYDYDPFELQYEEPGCETAAA